ncbi:MAG: hypothetical protein IT458_03725 [Planctomycetes bacterium]|nr:hypothetical protein [Planctomycetota bacterium]
MSQAPWWRDPRADTLWVVVAALLAYGTALAGAFVYDDLHSVRDNEAIRDLGNLVAFLHRPDMFSAADMRMYRPVLLASFALNHAVSGPEALGFKLGNLLLHAATAAGVLAVARRFAVGRAAALGAALVFAVHPLGSEAVNMISGRSELLSICALVWGVRAHLAAQDGVRFASLATLAALVVACGSKETGVILPLLCALLELRRGVRRVAWRGAVARLAPLVAMVGVYLAVRQEVLGHAAVPLRGWHEGDDPMVGAGRSPATQLMTMATLLPRVLAQMVVPLGLSLDPRVEYRSAVDGPVAAGAALVLGLVAAGLWRPARNPLRAFGVAFALGTALPWILIPLNVPLSEHRYYGPLAGAALVCAALVPRAAAARLAVRRGLAAAAALWLASAAVLSAARSLDYRDEERLWQQVRAQHPGSMRAATGLALAAIARGDGAAARRFIHEALAIYPNHRPARENLVEVELGMRAAGDPQVALEHAEWLKERDPANPFAWLRLSRAMAAVGERSGDPEWFARAEAAALHCLVIAPPKGLAYRTAADARARRGDPEGAIALLDESIARGLAHRSVRVQRAELLLQVGRRGEAERELHRLAAEDPFDPMVIVALQKLRGAGPGR